MENLIKPIAPNSLPVSHEGIWQWNLEEGELFLVNKPYTWTSFDVVAKIRNTLKIKKIGHTGTLDPLATGLLMIAIGKYTKKIATWQEDNKEYIAEITLGGTTPTYDAEFLPETLLATDHLIQNDILEVLPHFEGALMQYPPIYSAIKIKGKTAYELARRGKEVNLPARPVYIEKIELLDFTLPRIIIKVNCSKGTYIRSLAHDIGQKLGVGGYLSNLIRTRIGQYHLKDAWELNVLIDMIKTYK